MAVSATVLAIFSFISSSAAQQLVSGNSGKEMRSELLITVGYDESQTAVNNETFSMAELAAINPGLTKKFTARFPQAQDAKWFPGKECYLVTFSTNNQHCRGSFTSTGKMNYVIAGCSQDQLPAAISKRIQRSYKEYRFFNAIQVDAHNDIAHQVVLENDVNYVTLVFSGDDMEEVKTIVKNK